MDFKLKFSNGFKIYLIVFIVSLIVFIIFYSNFPAWIKQTNSDSALYLLSSLVQSEAAVLGIVVTLSIVAIQHTASSYSTRVIGIFKESASLWILVLTYIIAIVYGLWVLKFISPLNNLSTNEFQIWIAYLLGIYAFSALIPYILDILNLMNPKTIIKRLSSKITKQNIMLTIGEEDVNFINYRPSSGPIQPLSDIMLRALMKYDYGTLKDGLKSIEKSMLAILQNSDLKDEENDISKHLFIHHILRLGEMAVDKTDESSATLIIESLYRLSIMGINQKYSTFSEQAAFIIQEIGIKAALKNNGYILSNSHLYLNVIGQAAAGKKGFEHLVELELDSELRVILTAITSLPEPKVKYDISMYANDLDFDPELNLLLDVVTSNELIGNIALEQKNETILRNVVKNLEKIKEINGKLYEKRGHVRMEEIIEESIQKFINTST